MADQIDKHASLLAQLEVFHALEDGDGKPLADYLLNGGDLVPALRQHLAAMLDQDGDTTFKLVLKGRRPGELGWSTTLAANDKKMSIGVFMERRVRAYGKGGYEAARAETEKQFNIGKTTLEKAHQHVKNVVKSYSKRDMWAHLNAIYPDP